MGLSLGIHCNTVKNDDGMLKCVPDSRYRKMAPVLRKPAGGLILETEAYEAKLFERKRVNPRDMYWWTDVQFVPNDDTTIFITGGMFTPRSNQAWIGARGFPAGKIVKLNLDKLSAEFYNDTRMTNYPKIQIHPSGKYFEYISYECIKIETLAHKEVFNKHRDLRSCNYRFCAFSPNGKYLAIILSASKHLECILSMLDKGFTFHDRDADLTNMLPGFRCRHYNEHVELKWSPDSEYIAVCSSFRFCFILNKELQIVTDVTGHILPENVFPSWSSTFDFDPRSCRQIMAVGANDRSLYFVNTDTEKVMAQSEVISKEAIDCVLYHPFGDSVAVAFRDFNIYFLHPDDGQVTFQINMRFHSPNLEAKFASFPALMRMSFSSTGDQIATSTCDGRIHLWQLPADISLFNLCKWTILSHVPQSQLHKLPLPGKIVSKMLSMPSLY